MQKIQRPSRIIGSPNILLMCYEDMKKDLTLAVTQIATFMGYSLTDDAIKNIVDATTFDKIIQLHQGS